MSSLSIHFSPLEGAPVCFGLGGMAEAPNADGEQCSVREQLLRAQTRLQEMQAASRGVSGGGNGKRRIFPFGFFKDPRSSGIEKGFKRMTVSWLSDYLSVFLSQRLRRRPRAWRSPTWRNAWRRQRRCWAAVSRSCVFAKIWRVFEWFWNDFWMAFWVSFLLWLLGELFALVLSN